MTEQDEKDLRELQAEIGAAEKSPWEPHCVAAAFCSEASGAAFVLTMQAWIDLEAERSPFLRGILPGAEDESEWDGVMCEYDAAFRAFGHRGTTPEKLEPDELLSLGMAILRVLKEAFAMRVALAPPEGGLAQAADSGMGNWLAIMACLVGQMGFGRVDALNTPVAQAFALIAAHRVNFGWRVVDEPYALRGVAEEEAQDG